MTDLTNDICLAFEQLHDSGRLGLLVEEAIAMQAKATPSRGQIAAMVMAGLLARPDCQTNIPRKTARVAIKHADALLAELAKSKE